MTRLPAVVRRVGMGGVVMLVLAACAGDSESPLGVTADSVIIAENAVIVDSTVLALVSDSATRTTGIYQFVVSGSAPEIESGDVIIGGEQGGFLRRVLAVSEVGDTLVLQTEQAALTDAVERGAFSITVPIEPGGDAGASASLERVEWGATTVVRANDGVAVVDSGIGLANLVLFDGEACSSAGTICADLQLVVQEGVVDFSSEIDIGAEIDFGGIQKAHATVSGALQLDAVLAASASAELDYQGELALLTFRTPFSALIPPSPLPVTGYIETKFFAGFSVTSQGQVGLSTGFESLHSIATGGVYEDGEWTPLFETERSYANRPTTWDGSVALEANLTVRPEVGVYLYTVAGGFINLGPYAQFTGAVYPGHWEAELAAGLAAELGLRLRILSWDLAEFSHETSLAEAVLFSDSGAVAVWEDGFETYATQSWPSENWAPSGNSDGAIDETVANSGSQSFKLYGVVGSYWATLAYREIAATPPWTLEFSVRNGSELLPSSGHQNRAAVEIKTGPDWTYDGRNLLYFNKDGHFYLADGSDGGAYTVETWYHFTIKYYGPVNGNITIAYWNNGEAMGEVVVPAKTYEAELSYVGISAQAGTVWYDDLRMSQP